MKKLKFKYCLLSFSILLAANKSILCQVPDFSKVPNVHAGDSLNITYLINNGIKIADRSVIAWFPKDSLSKQQMDEIVKMLNTGISEAEKFIKAPLYWQVHQPAQPYTFYFRHDRFVSHASDAGFVSIPFWRIKEGKSPWLHEVMHEMLNSKAGNWFDPAIPEEVWKKEMPHWLTEGLPDYIALNVSIKNDLLWFDVFSNSNQTNIDSMFLVDLKSANGKYVLKYIGANGVIPELSSKDRALYAPTFYHGSNSFVKYLAEHYGLEMLLTSISSIRKENETIEKLTGKSLKSLREEWLAKLNILE